MRPATATTSTDAGHLFSIATNAIAALMEVAEKYEGLFPSIIDRGTNDMPVTLPLAIDGQRVHDRAFPGCNLLHDLPVLATMYDLGGETARSADRYLQWFATHCTDTPTGLFPWGEHAFWNLRTDAIGNSLPLDESTDHPYIIHDHLRAAPTWFWEKLWQFNPDCVKRFAAGLDYHWKGGFGHPIEYSRHAFLTLRAFPGRGDANACDFPRHGGFFILDWAFAFSRTGEQSFLEQIERMADYWWIQRDHTNLCPIESRSERWPTARSANQTLSLALSLFDAAALLQETDAGAAEMLREQAAIYTAGFVNAPHDPANGVLVGLFDPADLLPLRTQPLWGSRYGSSPAAQCAMTAMGVYRQTKNVKLLEITSAIGGQYANNAMPTDAVLPARDAALSIALLCDLYEQTGEQLWIDAAIAKALSVDALFFDNGLPRGATGIGWYEAQLGSGLLIHAFARVGSLAASNGATPAIHSDYTYR